MGSLQSKWREPSSDPTTWGHLLPQVGRGRFAPWFFDLLEVELNGGIPSPARGEGGPGAASGSGYRRGLLAAWLELWSRPAAQRPRQIFSRIDVHEHAFVVDRDLDRPMRARRARAPRRRSGSRRSRTSSHQAARVPRRPRYAAPTAVLPAGSNAAINRSRVALQRPACPRAGSARPRCPPRARAPRAATTRRRSRNPVMREVYGRPASACRRRRARGR